MRASTDSMWDDRALELEAPRVGPAALPLAHHPDVHARSRRAAQPVHRLLQRHVEGGLLADAHDAVTAVQTRAIRGCPRDRADHGELVIPDRDHDAEAAELASRAHPHVLVRLRVEEHGVRVERAEHAVDGRFLHLAQVDLLVVEVLLDEREDVAEALRERPRAVHVVHTELAAGGVDLERQARRTVFVVDEDGCDLTLDRVETAQEHAPRLDALGLDVVLDDLHEHAVHQGALGEIVGLVRADFLRPRGVVDVDLEAVALGIEVGEREGPGDRQHAHAHLEQTRRARARRELRRRRLGPARPLAPFPVVGVVTGVVRFVHRCPRSMRSGKLGLPEAGQYSPALCVQTVPRSARLAGSTAGTRRGTKPGPNR
jgi:hypothetical protein